MAHKKGDEIKTVFEEIIDDSVSDELFFSMLEGADEELRDERDWYILREKTSITRAQGAVYTDGNNLPTNFDRVRTKEDAVRSDSRVYQPIDHDESEEYKDSDGYYYLKYDADNEVWQIFFTGTGQSAETVYILYQKRGTEITADNSDTAKTWLPGSRGTYLAWLMASRISGGVDGDEINFRMSPEQKDTAEEKKQTLESWDAKQRLRAMGGRTRMRRGRRPLGDSQIDLKYPYRA